MGHGNFVAAAQVLDALGTAPGGSAKNTGPGSEHVYTATLSLQPAANTLPSWVCHLVGATS